MDTPQFAIRPSAVAMIVACNGYLRMAASYPDDAEGNEVRDDGTACHEVAYQQGQFGKQYSVGDVASNGRSVTREMLDAAEGYLAMLRRWNLPVYLEQTMAIPRIHPQCGGTPDAWAIDWANKIIRLADLKFGFVPVDPFENLQLVPYLVGIMDAAGIDGFSDQQWRFEFTIYQPRDFGRDPCKRWFARCCDVRPLVTMIQEAVHWALSDSPMLKAGSHCANCSARHACPVLKQASAQALEIAGQGVPLELDPPATGDELRRLEMAEDVLKARISGLRQRAEYMIANGNPVPWFEMAPTHGRRRWKEGAAQRVLATGQMLGMDLREEVSVISPAQIEKKGLDIKLFEQYIEKPSGMKLRRTDSNYVRKMMESINHGN